MPTFQVTCRELVYVDRTYEIEADTAAQAEAIAKKDGGNCVDEQVQDTHSFCGVQYVCDENGLEVAS